MNPALARWSFWLALLGTTASGPGFGQGPDRSRSHGPIPTGSAGVAANPAQLQQLAERFQDAEQREWLHLFESLKSNPQGLKRTLENPDEQKSLEALAEALKQGRYQPSADEVKTLHDILNRLDPEAIRRIQADPDLARRWQDLNQTVDKLRPKDNSSPQNPSGPESVSSPPANDPTKPTPIPEAPKPNDQPPARVLPPPSRQPLPEPSIQSQPWFARVKDWVGNNRVFQDSPALRQAVQDLADMRLRADGGGVGGGDLGIGEKTAQWIDERLPRQFWADSVLPKIRDFPLPTLPHVELPNVHFSTPSLPSLDLPSVSAPAPASSRGETVFLSLFTVAVVALVLWRLYGERLRRKGRSQGPDWAQGNGGSVRPPALDLAVRSREDLIRAFEQLSLVKLGSAAQSWNHLHLAANLGGKLHEHRRLADHLAFLYEQARYAPGDHPLSPDALRMARRELAILAGVASA